MEALANIVHELWQAQNWKTISKKRHQEKISSIPHLYLLAFSRFIPELYFWLEKCNTKHR